MNERKRAYCAGGVSTRRRLLIAAWGLITSPLYAGTIQGLDIDPPLLYVNSPVQVSVTGIGACANGVVLDYGDGSSDEQSGDLPLIFSGKTYAQSGSYTISAASKPGTLGCNGSVSLDVAVKKPGDLLNQLCLAIDCDVLVPKKVSKPLGPDHPAAMGPPKIHTSLHLPPAGGGIPGYPQRLVPGGKILVGGERFGDSPGQVFITGIPGKSPLQLEILEWNQTSSGKISAMTRIPDSVDQPVYPIDVKLYVKRASGLPQNRTSPGVDKQFEAPGEVVKLTIDDPAVQVVQCGDDSNSNRCNNETPGGSMCMNYGSANQAPNIGPTGAAVYGYHANCWGAVGDDKGTDKYKISLKGGWVIHEVKRKAGVSSVDDDNWVFGPKQFGAVLNKSFWQFSVPWKVTPADSIKYRYEIWIEGPPKTRWW